MFLDDFNFDNIIFFDVECYYNYFLVVFSNHEKTIEIETSEKLTERDKKIIRKILESYTTVGFNSLNYDLPLLIFVLNNDINTNEIKQYSEDIIAGYAKKNYNLNNAYKHIDLIKYTPVGVGLKKLAGRLNFEKIQDLPYVHTKILTDEEKTEVKLYCNNDVNATKTVYTSCKKEIDLRYNLSVFHNINLMSKTRAGVAEYLYSKKLGLPEYKDLTKISNKIYNIPMRIPEGLSFETSPLTELSNLLSNSYCVAKVKKDGRALNCNFYMNFAESNNADVTIISNNSHKNEPVDNYISLNLFDNTYLFKKGGLHIQSKPFFVKDRVEEYDVVSYYPNLIMSLNIGSDKFLDIYKDDYSNRIKAKNEGDSFKAEVLKLLINSVSGKLNDPYSNLFNPTGYITMTITGQLYILKLIEMLKLSGIRVISANTDSVTITNNNKSIVEEVIKKWTELTKFELGKSCYSFYCSKDVNNYYAYNIDKKTGNETVKKKGCFSEFSIIKDPAGLVVYKTLVKYLRNKLESKKVIVKNKVDSQLIYDILASHYDIRDFFYLKQQKSGFVVEDELTKAQEYIGKVCRWYLKANSNNILKSKDVTILGNSKLIGNSKGCEVIQIYNSMLDYNDYNIDYFKYYLQVITLLQKFTQI